MKSWSTLFLLLLLAPCGRAQHPVDTSTFLPGGPAPTHRQFSRKTLVVGASAIGYGASLLALNEAWYKQYQRASFHTFDDRREWLQMDKLGHGWAAYQLARGNTALWQWAGETPARSLGIGVASSWGYLLFIEWMDAHSEKWGWSWADVAANTGGVLLFAGQQMAWKDQRIQFKFSVSPRSYPADLEPRASQLFGKSAAARTLKDYNTQTYWLSVNLKSFAPFSNLPAWLNIAVGYGAEGMWGGFRNEAIEKDGSRSFYRPDIPRVRQWYLSPDIDFTKIKTNRKAVRTLLSALNCLKLPAPGLLLEKGTIKLYPL